MKARIKKLIDGRLIRFETSGDVKEILINENLLKPEEESISLCFRGENSSGIIDLSPDEFKTLFDTIKTQKKLIKDIKIIK